MQDHHEALELLSSPVGLDEAGVKPLPDQDEYMVMYITTIVLLCSHRC